MIFFNNNKVNKFGGKNKMYMNDWLIYQTYTGEQTETKEWVTLTRETSRYIPFRRIRIDCKVENPISDYCYIAFSETPNNDVWPPDPSIETVCAPTDRKVVIRGVWYDLYGGCEFDIGDDVYEVEFPFTVYYCNSQENGATENVQFLPL